MELMGGLALVLAGLEQLSDGLKTARIEVSMSDKLARMCSLIKRITEENVTLRSVLLGRQQ